MRTRILFVIAALLFPLLAVAGTLADRDMLLTSEGTLYTVESVAPESLPDIDTPATRVLTLTIQNGPKTATIPVPASLANGYHFTPALAYDGETKTLFIFWERMRDGGFTSDLAFCSYRSGTWGETTTLESIAFDLRQNLRIAITRSTESKDDDGNTISIPEVTVHAAWWEISGTSEWARYAMLTISNGNVAATHIQDLADFTTARSSPANGTDTQELLRHPAVFESANHATVDVVFGDVAADKLHRVTIRPVAISEGRLRIPIGRKDQEVPAPRNATGLSASSGVSAMSTSPDNLAFFASDDAAMRYYVLKSGKWSSQSVALNEKVSRDAAIEALRKMLASE